MTALIIQTALLLAIAFIIGCLIGCFLKRLFAGDQAAAPSAKAALGTTAAVAGLAATQAATRSAPDEPAPASRPVSAPEPVQAPATAAPTAAPAAIASVPVAKPRKQPAVRKAAVAPATKDDLKRIRGIGRQNEARLNAEGVSAFAQIAAWSKADQKEMGERLAFPGRIEREEWVSQAKTLAKGGDTAFSKRVAKGEVASSTGKGDVGELGKKPRVLKNARGGKPDNLTLVDGVGNAIEKKLFDLGVFHFDQMAKWTADEAKWVSQAVGFPGRAERENWVADATKLAAGEMTAHAKKVEKGAIPTSRKSTSAQKAKPAKKK